MADNPITVPLPQDLPQNWTYGQTIGPQGTDVGLTKQHGYNYLMQQVNAAQQAAQELGAAFHNLYGEDDIVPVVGGGTGAEDAQNALNNLGAGVRPNELDNPGLDINQRGAPSYNTASGGPGSYTIDRWWNVFGIYDVTTRTLTSTNQTYGAGFRQPINNPSRFAGKTVTITAWIASGVGTLYIFKGTGVNSGQVKIAQKSIDGPGLYTIKADIPNDVGGTSYPYLSFAVDGSVGGTIQFAQQIPFKLEFGEGQTLAYQDSNGNWQMLPQPDSKPGEMLAECQRYYQLYSSAEERPSKAIDCRPVMRIDPTQGTIEIDDVTYYYNDANL